MLKHWEFWFTIIGAIITGLLMFGDLKQEIATQQTDIKYIREDVAEIREAISDSKHSAFRERLANDNREVIH